jgi:hypothetical protein
MSLAQGVVSSSSMSVPFEKMPRAWGGRGIGQLHCLEQKLPSRSSYHTNLNLECPTLAGGGVAACRELKVSLLL